MPDQDQLKDEHDFDGILEYDNNLPLWWQAIFYMSILVSVLYIGYYHFGGGQLGPEALAAELKAIEDARLASGPLDEATLRSYLGDAGRIANGKNAWAKANCQQCHGPEALGQVGPNLRDDYWRHGSSMEQLVHNITNGFPEAGMNAQTQYLSAAQIVDLAVYLVEQNVREKANGQGMALTDADLEDPITYWPAN